jgi:cytoskeletal protein CcmA (bactofilin family)
MYDISQSYYPMVLEIRDTAVELNESLEVFNSRVVLTEIPDTFMKVYLSGYVEIEESKLPKQGEYVVDYKTGIVTMGGSVPDNTIVNASYYGRGIIQYPAERIYSHNPSPEVAGSLQRILDRGEEAITELNVTADLSKRQSHANTSSFFGNQDWTRMIYEKQGTGQVNYNSTVQGVEVNGYVIMKINTRIPVDPESRYWIRSKVKKTVGDGKFYIGAISLDNNYEEISTDTANSYNYFGASAQPILSGMTEVVEGSISGYNLATEGFADKFDPEAKYFNLVVICNLDATADITKTVIEWLEIYRSPKSMHVEDNGSFGGTLDVKGKADFHSPLDMNNNPIKEVMQVDGQFGNIAKSTDEWLRINDGGGHTNGVFFGNSLVRTDGNFNIGSNGSILNVTSTLLNFKGLLSVDALKATIVPDTTINGNVDIDKTLNVDGSTSVGGNLEVRVGSKLDIRDGQTTLRASTGATTLVVYQEASTGFLAKMGVATDSEIFTINKNGDLFTKGSISADGSGAFRGTLDVTGATLLKSTLDVTGAVTMSNRLDVSGNAEIVGKVWAGKNISFGSVPSVTLAIGDADTGLNWNTNGVIDIIANSLVIAQYSPTKFDIMKKLNAKASMSITGSLDVSDDVVISDTLTSGSTSVGALTVRSGGSLIVNSSTTFNSPVDLVGNTINNVDVMNFKNGGFTVDVNSITRDGGIEDTYNIYALEGKIKLWRPTHIVGNTSITGNLAITGTVDGVDVSDFKAEFDQHHHDTRYLKTSGDSTLNGNVIVGDGFSIYPLTPNGATLGTIDNPFKDVFIGANSLYVDGKKVVSSEADTIDISTDPDQHMSINTSGLGTTRLASGKEVVIYSGQLVTLQSLGNMTALSSGLVSLKSDANGSGIELVSQSALGNINITSGNRIEFSATGDISFLQRPKFNGSTMVTFADNISASKITQSSTLRFVTDADKVNWNGKVNRAGDTMTGFLTLHADPTQPLHAVTKQYVDAVKQSLDIKDSVKVATSGNVTLSGGATIDGVVLNVGDRVLVKHQTDATQNGIYVVQTGAWTRAIDFDQDTDVTSGAFVFVEQGTLGGNMGYVLVTDGAINIGVTPLSFTQFSGAGQVIAGTGIYKNGNEIGIADTGITAGTYKSVTVNAQGQVTAGSNPTTVQGYGITNAIRTDQSGSINGTLTVNKLVSKENGFTVTIPAGSSSVTLTHNLNTTNYKVALGTNSVSRHAGWSSKLANSLVIEIDDVFTSDIAIDVILMPMA